MVSIRNAAARSIYGLSETDPRIFHILVRADIGALKGLLEKEPRNVLDRMKIAELTPLMAAAGLGDKLACEMLLSAGAALDETNSSGQTALHRALLDNVDVEREAVVLLFLKHGANLALAQSGNVTALHHATRYGNVRLVSALIDAGADVNAKDHNESTPAIGAAYAGRVDIMRALESAAADIVSSRQNNNIGPGATHDTCLTVAAEQGHEELVCHLLKGHCWPEQVVNVALKLAAMEGHLAITTTLVAHGADPFVASGANQKSALDRARFRKRKEIVEYFIQLRKERAVSAKTPRA